MRIIRGGLGRLPLPPDNRDYKMASILPPRSARRSRYWWEGAVWLDQGATGTCVGNAWTHWLADGPTTHESMVLDEAYARQLYVDATGDTTLQQGAYTRDVLNIVVKRGLAGAYYAAQSVDDIVTHLLDVGPVCFACAWKTGMDQYRVEFGWPWLQNSGSIRGGHEFILNGVNMKPVEGPPFVRMKNSWGRGWARGGNAKISIETLTELFTDDPDCFVATELSSSP